MSDLPDDSPKTGLTVARPVVAGLDVGRQPVQSPPGPILRFWLWLPDWVFRAAGAIFFLAYAYGRMTDYVDWPRVGPYYSPVAFVDGLGRPHYGPHQYFPWTKIVIDLTFVLIALSFMFRVPPRRRADRPSQIIIPMVAGFWPLLPFFVLSFAKLLHSPLQARIEDTLTTGDLSAERYGLAMALLTIGNGLDVWGYSVLFRSLSIVAEARVLKRRGPYRWIRHPIYLGQFISQAGFFLILVQLQLKWIVFYAAFVAMQLYRARVEEGVLVEAFGDEYERYRRQTWWFW